MLRLADSAPPLWRTASSMQLGTESPVRLDDVAPWQELLLDDLATGIPDDMLVPLARSHGAPAGEAAAFVDRIAGALGDAGHALPDVRVELPADLCYGDEQALVQGLAAAGLPPLSATRWTVERPDPAIAVIAVSHRLMSPQRAGRFMAADIAHLPIDVAGDQVSVGPLVVPGRTPCLACRNGHRRDRDPSWPLLAAQLLGRPGVSTDAALLVEAAALALRLLRLGAQSPSLSVVLSASSERRRWHAHRVHPACLCRSPPETWTVDASPPPTTATTTAPPA